MNESDLLLKPDARMGEIPNIDPMSENVRIAVVIPEELKQRLDSVCEKEHRSLSGQVHMWIVQKVEEWEAQHQVAANDRAK